MFNEKGYRRFKRKHEVQLSTFEERVCEKFAQDCVETNWDKYQQNGSPCKSKAVWDIAMGKEAEVAMYVFLVDYLGLDQTTLPDFKVYPVRKKSFDADLKCGDVHFSVKCVDADSKLGQTWLFAKRDKFITKKFPANQEHFALLVVRDAKEHRYEVVAMLDARKFDGYGAPKLTGQKTEKLAVYLSDLV